MCHRCMTLRTCARTYVCAMLFQRVRVRACMCVCAGNCGQPAIEVELNDVHVRCCLNVCECVCVCVCAGVYIYIFEKRVSHTHTHTAHTYTPPANQRLATSQPADCIHITTTGSRPVGWSACACVCMYVWMYIF